MRPLLENYADDARTQTLREALITVAPGADVVIGSCAGSLASVLLAAACPGITWPRLIVAGDAAQVVADCEELGLSAALLPESDRFGAGDEEAPASDHSAHQRRVAAIEAYAAGAILVATPASVSQPVPDLAQVAKQSIIVRPGENHDLQKLVDRLVDAGYRVRSVVEGRGELAVRGGVIDIYPYIGNDPLRLEFFGDEIESIRRFDAFTQESVAKAHEAVLASTVGSLATRNLWEQLPPGPVVVFADLPLRGRLSAPHGRREVRLARQLESDAVDGASVGVDRLRGDLQRGMSELQRMLGETAGTRALFLARNEEADTELRHHCQDHGIEATIVVGRLGAGWRDLERGLVVVHDFELAARQAAKRRVGTRVAGGSPLTSLTDLKRGDLVVHVNHGIACFRGMATLEKRGYLEDFLELEFSGGTKLFVPVDVIELVQKYVSATGSRPELSKIGGTAWAKRRAKADKAIEDISAELLDAQAKRIAAGGIAFAADGPSQRQFEAAFPYEETEDQLSATREIKADMEQAVAMDRLLCGDVGFGKTEVAMRAAFKAVADGRQVAVLAPTTLLAEQHVETFSERFAGHPAVVAGLTRFTTGSDRNAVLDRVAKGEVHILIGTHALLTDALRFAHLGLLIIDEEHRFGVKQKEKLRRLRTDDGLPPDVLTLSATPIPRTLHLSLLGIRDISVLAEPPSERLAVETRVAPWDDRLLQTAIRRELERKGQTFVVHNRVQDIDRIMHKVATLVPELRIDVVHGQMEEGRIARTMDAYKRGELQCLVSTSIIESGIDIPNANTLFVNNAHFFGLAELHQIRGRIGRHHNQAYAYFLVPGNAELTQEARERLDAIQEYADLGAGFKLAMRDLELRGAGNLLGGEQSGHIDAIGYELYTRLLGDAVTRNRNKAAQSDTAAGQAPRPVVKSRIEARNTLGLAVDAYVPDDYVEAAALKFELHKHLDGCRRPSDVQSLERTIRDRYGAPPPPVRRLFAVRLLRLRCAELGVLRIEVGDRQLRLHLDGPLPATLAKANLPELVHVQLDGAVLVLFVKPVLEPDVAINLLTRLLGIETAARSEPAAQKPPAPVAAQAPISGHTKKR